MQPWSWNWPTGSPGNWFPGSGARLTDNQVTPGVLGLNLSFFAPTVTVASGAWAPTDLGSALKAWYKADAGVLARTAAQTTAANSESLSHSGTAALRAQSGTGGWYRCGWLYLTNTGTRRVLQSCLSGNDGYLVEVTAGDVLKVSAGTGAAVVTATHGTALSAATWYFWSAKYDGTNVSIGLNGGTYVDALLSTYSPGSAAWYVGADVTPANFWNGAQQEILGDNGDLSGANLAILYAAGAGIASTGTALGAWWFPLHENSGTRTDVRAGAIVLTDNNTVTAADGKVSYAAADGDAVWKWQDQSGLGIDMVQATHAAKPIYKTSIVNSLPVVRFDGTDDYLVYASAPWSTSTSWGAFLVGKLIAGANAAAFALNGVTGASGWGIGTVSSGKRNLLSAGIGFMLDGTKTNNFEKSVATRNSTGPVWALRVNGADQALTPNNTSMTVPATEARLGYHNGYANVDIAEFFTTNTLPSAGDITSMEDYGTSRYAL